MDRNQYDTDTATWSPQGKLHQVEYAKEAVRQGSCSLGIRSKKFAVVGAIKRSHNELSSRQEKVFKIDDHMGIAISGLTADARSLATYMRSQCMSHRYQMNSHMITGRLVRIVADKHQKKTMESWNRPYGVGLLVIGHDRDGPHLYETSPSGEYSEYVAMAIGARSQSARTYLVKHKDSFMDADLATLIQHAILALKGPANDKELTAESIAIGVVGENVPFRILENAELQTYLDSLKSELGALGESSDAAEEKEEEEEAGADAGSAAAAPMEIVEPTDDEVQ